MKKRISIFLIILTILALLTALLVYVNRVYLPAYARQKITREISRITSSKVTLGSLELSLIKGLVIEDLVIYDKDAPEKIMAQIREARVSILIWPSFQEKKIILPDLTLLGAEIFLERRKDKTWNIDHLLEQLNNKTGSSSLQVLVKHAALKDSILHYLDESEETPVNIQAHIEHADLRMGLSRAALKLVCSVTRNALTSRLTLDGHYTYVKETAGIRLVLQDVDLKNYQDLLKDEWPAPADGLIDSLEIDASVEKLTHITSQTQINARNVTMVYQDYEVRDAQVNGRFSLTLATDNWSSIQAQGLVHIPQAFVRAKTPLEAEAHLSGGHIDFKTGDDTISLTSDFIVSQGMIRKEEIQATGVNATVRIQSRISTAPGADEEQKIPPPVFTGSATLTSGQIRGVPRVENVNILSSLVSFENNDITFKNTSIETSGVTLLTSGTFKDSALALDASGVIKLENLWPLLEQEATSPIKEISGEAKTILRVSTKGPDAPIEISGEAELTNPSIFLREPALHISAKSGNVSFNTQNETFAWHLADLAYLDRLFNMDGDGQGFPDPRCHISIQGTDTRVSANFKKTGEVIDITTFQARVKESELQGSARLQTAQKIFHVNANGDLKLTNLKEWMPDKTIFEAPLNLSGTCRVQADISGPLGDWKSWTIKSNTTSRSITLRGYTANNVTLNYTQISGEGFINFLSFGAYGGQGEIKGRLRLTQEPPRYDASAQILKLDLNLLKKDLPELKDKVFYGTLDIQAVVNGQGADTRTISGQGQLSARNGNIWEFNPLKGLGNFLFAPRFNTLTFSDARGDFDIRDGWITTNNLELLGKDLSLFVEGSIGFDGTLDLLASSQVPKTGPGQSPIGDVVTKAGGMTAIKITGTTQKPVYKLQPITKNIIRKLEDLFSNIAP